MRQQEEWKKLTRESRVPRRSPGASEIWRDTVTMALRQGARGLSTALRLSQASAAAARGVRFRKPVWRSCTGFWAGDRRSWFAGEYIADPVASGGCRCRCCGGAAHECDGQAGLGPDEDHGYTEAEGALTCLLGRLGRDQRFPGAFADTDARKVKKGSRRQSPRAGAASGSVAMVLEGR